VSRGNPSQVSSKTAFTVSVTVLGVALGAWLVWRTTTALLVTAGSLLIAAALNRLVDWLEAHHLPRGAGIAVVMLGIVAAVVGLGFLIVPPIVDQANALVTAWPRIVADVQKSSAFQFAARHTTLQSLLERAQAAAPQALGAALAILRGSATALVAFVTVLFVTLFMLTSGRPLVWSLLAQARPERRARYARVTRNVYHTLGAYVAGHVFIVGVQGCATSTFLAVVGVPYFLPLGISSALASLIPFAGVTVAGAVISVVAWASGGLWTGIATAIYYVAYQQLEDHVLYPLVYRRAVAVNPLLTVLGVLFLAELGGIAGAILAVPLVAAGHVVVRELLAERRARLGIPPAVPTPAAAADGGERRGHLDA
jgi:predicted PurR-regulated permease PerM